ncbi:MAG: T9SS C-terminal target domain-containing protein [Bacteroidetes bacterium]|nr:MAG: T9SS C-terminal target domain-containing protein [Bacteroidota bacterium]
MKNYIFTLPVFALLLLAANVCKAQDTIIGYSDNYIIDTRLELLTGSVTNAEDGSAIQSAHIILTGQYQYFEAISDSLGQFSVGPAGQGYYVLSVTRPGFINFTESINITGEQGQTLEIVMVPSDSITVHINEHLTVNADNVNVDPNNVFKLTGNVNINGKLFFGGQLTVDIRHTGKKTISGNDSIYIPDIDGAIKVISAGNNTFEFDVQADGLYASGPGSFFPMPSTIGGFPVKAAAIVLPPSTDDVVVKTIPDLPYPVDVVFERYLTLGLPTKNLLDYISATFIYNTIEGTENIAINISNLSANLGPVGIENLDLYYYSDNQVFGGSLTLKISSEKKEKDPLPDTTRVVIRDEYGDYLTEMTLGDLIDVVQTRKISTMKIIMGIEFVSGALNSLEVGFSTNIPIFTTGLFITWMQGGVHDLVTENWYLDASVEIQPGAGYSPVTIAGNIMIQPMDVFRGGGDVTLFNRPKGGATFEYNRPLKSISLEGYYLAYGGILRGDIYAGLQGSKITASGLMTVKTPSIPCSFWNPTLCWISWAGNRHIGSAQVDIDNTRMQARVWVKAGSLGTLSMAARLVYEDVTSFPDFYIGTNYNNMKKIFKGTRDGYYLEIFEVPENTASIMISAHDTLTYEMFDFTVMSPDSVFYDHTYQIYECFDEHDMCVMVINLPEPGDWEFFTDHQGPVSLYTMAIDQAPTAMVNQPEDRRTRSNHISLTLNDYRDTLNVEVYYNTHNREFNGTLINEFTVINNADLDFTWNNADVDNGEYFIYTRIDDGKNAPVLQYAPGSIWVENDPFIFSPQNLQAYQIGDSVMVTWDDHDADYIYATAVYYRDMSTSITRQIAVLTENNVMISGLTQGRGYEIWAEFINDEGTYSSASNTVMVILTSQNRNNPPFFTMDRDSTFVFVAGEEAQYTLHAMDADGDILGFYLPGDTLGVSIDGDILFWTPTEEQTGVFRLKIVVSDGAATDTTYQRLAVYIPEEVNPQLAFNSVNLYELDNNFLRLRNFYATEPTQSIMITNLRTGEQTPVVARRVNQFEYIGQFFVSVQNRSDVPVMDGDTIIASYTWKNETMEAMAFYNSNPQDSDTIPPGTINDLTAERLPGNKVKLRWTATGNDGDVGKAYRYDMRYAFQPIESKDVYIRSHRVTWVSDPLPYPAMAGMQDSVVINLINIPGITGNEMIYFSILAEDEAQNRGELSNSPGVMAAPEPYNLTAQIQDVYFVYVNWQGPTPSEPGEEGFSHYMLYRRFNNGGWALIQQPVESQFTDNLKVFPDGNYQYAVRAVYTSWEGDLVEGPVIQMNRFINVNILCALHGAESNANIHFQMTGLDDSYTQQFVRTTNATGLVLLNNVFKSDYLLELSKEQYMTLTDTITVSDTQHIFNFMLYCDPLPPVELVVLETGLESVVLDWNKQSLETQWDISYGPAGFDPDLDGNMIEGLFSRPFNLTGLLPGVEYDIYVRAVCGVYVSDWSQPISVLASHAIMATAGDGGSIIPEGLIAVAPGGNYSFAIVPGEGHHIDDVLVNDQSIGATESYEFIQVTENFTIHAEFAINVYPITAAPNNPDFGTVTGAGSYEHFEEVTLTATPANGYHFINWTEDGEEVTTDDTYSFIAESDRNFVAHFAINVYDVNAVPNNPDFGTVTGAGSYEHFEEVTLTATHATGYHFLNWTEDGEEVTTDDTYSFIAESDRNFVAHFAINVYDVNAVPNNPDFGTVTGAGSYEHFEEVTLTATHATGYHFLNWTEDGEEVTTDDTYSFIAESDRNFVAHFAINVYTISALPNNPDWGNVQGAGDYEHGQDVTLEAIPAINYVFLRWTENDEEVGDTPEYNFTALSPRSLMAHFDPEVSIADIISNEVVIFPNPFSNSITITNALYVERLLINNVIGQLILEKTLSGSEQETISTENLPKGIYLITLIDKDGYRQVRKMVKE